MAKSYFSTVFERNADDIWSVVRDFGNYEWAGVAADTAIEAGRPGDAVGAVRRVSTPERTLRQRLLAHSDLERSYTYELCEPVPFAVRGYHATLRITGRRPRLRGMVGDIRMLQRGCGAVDGLLQGRGLCEVARFPALVPGRITTLTPN